MEFVIQKSTLVRELQTVTGVVEKRTTLPILANLLLKAEDGKLLVGASDLEVTVRGHVEVQVRAGGGVTLPAGKLHEIARSLPDAEVLFKVLDRNQVRISCERTQYRISGQPAEDFPEFPEVDVAAATRLPGVALREMIERVAFAITTEDPRYSLHGALLLLKDGSITMVATDGYRLSFVSRRAQLTLKGGELRVIVPRKALTEISKLAAELPDGEEVSFGRVGNHVFFVVGTHVLTSTVPEGAFPKYDEVMPKSCETQLVVPTGALADAVRRVSLLASDRLGRAIRFRLATGQLELSCSTELGDAQEVLPIEYKGEEKTIGFNARYLQEFLSVVGTELVRLQLDPTKAGEEAGDRPRRAGDKPGELRPEPPGEQEYRYIVMPRDL